MLQGFYLHCFGCIWARQEWSDKCFLNVVNSAGEAVNLVSKLFSDTTLHISFVIFFVEKLNDAELPPKRTILKKDFEYLSSIRLKLQEYLQVKYI